MKTPSTEFPSRLSRTVELVASLQRELTISFGGFVAVHNDELPDKLVWALSRNLSEVFRRQRQAARELEALVPDPSFHPHPAVTVLIAEIGVHSWDQSAAGGSDADE